MYHLMPLLGEFPLKLLDRFNETIIDELSKSEWWKMSDDEINVYAENFNDPLTFIEKVRK